jgi:hypothetical protein
MTLPLRAAVAAARAWTHFYTCGLPDALRDRRLAEVESDLWESHADAESDARLAADIAGRLLRGIADDVGWRVETGVNVMGLRSAAVIAIGVTVLGAALWTGMALMRADAPTPPAAPELRWHRASYPPPPPPPPPPPCNPPNIGRPQFSPCTPLGR